MTRDREAFYIFEAGCPTVIDYKDFKSKPFWRLHERLVFYKLETSRREKAESHKLQLSLARLGYPTKDVLSDAVDDLMKEADTRFKDFVHALLPYFDWDKQYVPDWSQSMMAQWYQRFAPDELPQFLERLEKQNGDS